MWRGSKNKKGYYYGNYDSFPYYNKHHQVNA